jgi:hypothetical protein
LNAILRFLQPSVYTRFEHSVLLHKLHYFDHSATFSQALQNRALFSYVLRIKNRRTYALGYDNFVTHLLAIDNKNF